MSRQQLKAIVKECLVEILQEGLGSGAGASMGMTLPVTESRAPQRPVARGKSPLDMQTLPNGRRPTEALAQAIKAEARGNALMADILADTAMTTLPKMLGAGDSAARPSEGTQSRVVQEEKFVGSPEEVFGEEAASKWANLAFMDAPAKKTA